MAKHVDKAELRADMNCWLEQSHFAPLLPAANPICDTKAPLSFWLVVKKDVVCTHCSNGMVRMVKKMQDETESVVRTLSSRDSERVPT